MRRKTIKHYFRLTVEALEECDIRLMPQPRVTTRDNTQKGVGGLYLPDTNEIRIRNCPEKENLLLTLIHEAWHHLRPTWKEKHINNWSRKLLCEFSTDDLKALSTYLRRH